MKDFDKVDEKLMNRKVKLKIKVEPHRKKIEWYRFKGIQYPLYDALKLSKLHNIYNILMIQ